MPGRTERTDANAYRAILSEPKVQDVFLEVLEKTGNVSMAAQTIFIAPSTALKYKKESSKFRRKWEDAYEAFLDMLEFVAVDRAVNGIMEPVYYKGDIVGEVRKVSDSNLQFLLKGRRSKIFRDKTDMNFTGLENLASKMALANKRAMLETAEIVAAKELEEKFTVHDPFGDPPPAEENKYFNGGASE